MVDLYHPPCPPRRARRCFEYACPQGWAYSMSGATVAAAEAMVSWGINAVRLPLNEQCWLASRATRRVPSVIFDAFNEPYSRGSFTLSWSCWKSGGCQAPVENDVTAVTGSTFTVVGMQTLVTTIRKAGAAQPIMLAGLDYANDLRGWLANKPSDSQLIASRHNYPGQRCNTVACWNSEIAPVASVVPVIASEFGQTDGGSSYLTTFMDWADAQGIGYAPWGWWLVDSTESLSGSRYALIADANFTPKAPAGAAYFAHLAGLPEPVAPKAPKAPSRTAPGDGPRGADADRAGRARRRRPVPVNGGRSAADHREGSGSRLRQPRPRARRWRWTAMSSTWRNPRSGSMGSFARSPSVTPSQKREIWTRADG